MVDIEKYFHELEDQVRACYSIAEEARKKGLDPLNKVEIPLARTLAEKVVGLISVLYPQINDERIVKRILELEKEFGQLDYGVAFRIAEEIAKEKFCKFESLLQAMEAGIRVGFAYATLGVVSSPIEGFTELKLGKTKEGKEYFVPYFSGPIRSAGTTASCMALILIDYIRETFGYAKFDPDENEIKRFVTEIVDYHERVTNLQYLPTEEESYFLAKSLPIQISGEPSEQREVSNFKDLPRVQTNAIRGGLCLIFGEGLAQKAQKAQRLLKGLQAKGFKISDWGFLDDYIVLHKKREKGSTDTSPTYIKDLVAGRPVFGHPSRSGGFRFRYGRSRVAGFSATSIHPATMGISNDFLSTGTQLKIEKPTKGCIISSCDSIDGPIVKLKNGSVKKFNNYSEAKKAYPNVEEIIYFGDILFPFGDVLNRNYELLKAGFVEEWWELELKKIFKEKNLDFNQFNIDKSNISLEKALELSKSFGVSLHPSFIFFWTQITWEEFLELLYYLLNANINEDKIILPYREANREKFSRAKRALELLGIEHEVTLENIVIPDPWAGALLANLGITENILEYSGKKIDTEINNIISLVASDEIKLKGVLFAINQFSKYRIRDKAGTFIGTRMGRPEKAKLRRLIGNPNVLFPVGEEGGRFRSVNESFEVGEVKAEFPLYFCNKCNKETIYFVCEDCGEQTKALYYCRECKAKFESRICPEHKIGQRYSNRKIDMKNYFKKAYTHLGIEKDQVPPLIKGVKGTSNENHIPENLAKGILRARHGLAVNKDGTIRYDGTEAPITHFKPKEVQAPIEKLRSLGYEQDIFGKVLENENQILELKPHDILISACPDTLDERGDDVFIKICNFIDDLLVKFYKLKPFYNVKKKEDLIGQLTVCISPHNCACVVSRIIGFSKTQTIFASPYIHAACRRDCDGDELAVMMLLDTLLNFSRQYLPSHRGGTQDAPLVLNARIRAGEVDDQILDLEMCGSYPLEMYELSEQGGHHSSEIKIDNVKQRLAKGLDTFTNIGFTHDTNDFNEGVTNSSYKTIPNMLEKVRAQMDLVTKLRAAETGDVARLVIDRHFMRDLRGNLRKFCEQEFRCVACNSKFRRPPLTGKCTKCEGKIIFTISYGSIVKYLEPATELANKYAVPAYIKQNLLLTRRYIESIFGKETEKQSGLGDFITS
ncbi:DNA polymerase II large subunit [Candidatus Pacearchaeota archaeon]|nr:DNA polymerase II large subunit [Candidatus Pacearchaeota archaeon]